MGFDLGGAISGALGSIGGSAISGIFGSSEAKKNRDFQERMSGTAHQREVADLKKAGLNPMLSAKLGGASTPGGAQATMPAPDIIGGISSAVQTKKIAKEVEFVKNQTKISEEQAKQASIQTLKDEHDYANTYGTDPKVGTLINNSSGPIRTILQGVNNLDENLGVSSRLKSAKNKMKNAAKRLSDWSKEKKLLNDLSQTPWYKRPFKGPKSYPEDRTKPPAGLMKRWRNN